MKSLINFPTKIYPFQKKIKKIFLSTPPVFIGRVPQYVIFEKRQKSEARFWVYVTLHCQTTKDTSSRGTTFHSAQLEEHGRRRHESYN